MFAARRKKPPVSSTVARRVRAASPSDASDNERNDAERNSAELDLMNANAKIPSSQTNTAKESLINSTSNQINFDSASGNDNDHDDSPLYSGPPAKIRQKSTSKAKSSVSQPTAKPKQSAVAVSFDVTDDLDYANSRSSNISASVEKEKRKRLRQNKLLLEATLASSSATAAISANESSASNPYSKENLKLLALSQKSLPAQYAASSINDDSWTAHDHMQFETDAKTATNTAENLITRILDPGEIHALKKLRDEKRNRRVRISVETDELDDDDSNKNNESSQDFISFDGEKLPKKNVPESRLVTEDQDDEAEVNDAEEEFDAHKGPRIMFGNKTPDQVKLERKKAIQSQIMDMDQDDEDTESDDDESRQWQEDQLRKAASNTFGKGKKYRRKKNADDDTEDENDGISYNELAMPTSTSIVAASEVLKSLTTALEALTHELLATTQTLTHSQTSLSTFTQHTEALQRDISAASTRYTYYQELVVRWSSLADLLDAKMPLFEVLEEDLCEAAAAVFEAALNARRDEVNGFVKVGLGAMSGGGEVDAFGREISGRENVVYRISEVNDVEKLLEKEVEVETIVMQEYDEKIASITEKKDLLLSDVAQDYKNINQILAVFSNWKKEYSPDFSRSYAGLTVHQAVMPFVKIEIIDWNPFAHNAIKIDDMDWHTVLTETTEFDDQDDKNAEALITLVIRKAIFPHVRKLIPTVDLFSRGSVQRCLRVFFTLEEYVSKKSAAFKGIIDELVMLMEKTVAEITNAYPANLTQFVAGAPAVSTDGREIFSNLITFKTIVAKDSLQIILINTMLNQYILPLLSGAMSQPSDILKYEMIAERIPKDWVKSNDKLLAPFQKQLKWLAVNVIGKDRPLRVLQSFSRTVSTTGDANAAAAAAVISSATTSRVTGAGVSVAMNLSPDQPEAVKPGRELDTKDSKEKQRELEVESLMPRHGPLFDKLRTQFESKLQHKGSAESAWNEYSHLLDQMLDKVNLSIVSHHFLFKSISNTTVADPDSRNRLLEKIVSQMENKGGGMKEMATVYQKLKDLPRLRSLINSATLSGTPIPIAVWNALLTVSLASPHYDFDAAEKAFNNLLRPGSSLAQPNARTFQIMTRHYLNHQKFKNVIDLLPEIRKRNISIESNAEAFILAYSWARDYEHIISLFEELEKFLAVESTNNLFPKRPISATCYYHAINAYGRTNRLEKIWTLYKNDVRLQMILQHDHSCVWWNTIMKWLSYSEKHLKHVTEIFQNLLEWRRHKYSEQIQANSFHIIITMCCRFSNSQKNGRALLNAALEWLKRMQTGEFGNLKPQLATFVAILHTLIQFCSTFDTNKDYLENLEKIYLQAKEMHTIQEFSPIIHHRVISIFIKSGQFIAANNALESFAKVNPAEIFKLVGSLAKAGVKESNITAVDSAKSILFSAMSMLISLVSETQNYEQRQWNYSSKQHFTDSVVALVSAYKEMGVVDAAARAKYLENVLQIFDLYLDAQKVKSDEAREVKGSEKNPMIDTTVDALVALIPEKSRPSAIALFLQEIHTHGSNGSYHLGNVFWRVSVAGLIQAGRAISKNELERLLDVLTADDRDLCQREILVLRTIWECLYGNEEVRRKQVKIKRNEREEVGGGLSIRDVEEIYAFVVGTGRRCAFD
ncbi:GC-rich sequence DNA-binding factor 2 [Physocladia obscura]|uniref:GC-rich sequence DNA-binding factor 2 n=1 Tax=Physocladia obscura TaxID=109957 RepID=A0AAD5T2N3_9FUNG|nr:GC-rich sequence DNA-binding factor 2 [Physocladia obscura]